ncbi:MAG: transcription elongation factor GreA [Bacilli bacterium]|nr:transcription elongation factor GreA [Bacilli bacterium]
MDSLIGQIIAEKVATLHELKTVYTLEDLYIMFEAIIVPKYNEYIAVEEIKKETERKRIR